MNRFTLLPVEIQEYILKIAKALLYEKSANCILTNWYRYMARKIAIFELSLSFQEEDHIEPNRISTMSIITIINPLNDINSKKINYINKYFTGKSEDLEYWKPLIKKFRQGLIYYRDYTLYQPTEIEFDSYYRTHFAIDKIISKIF